MFNVIYAESSKYAGFAECHYLNVVMLSVVMLNVVAPFEELRTQNSFVCNFSTFTRSFCESNP